MCRPGIPRTTGEGEEVVLPIKHALEDSDSQADVKVALDW